VTRKGAKVFSGRRETGRAAVAGRGWGGGNAFAMVLLQGALQVLLARIRVDESISPAPQEQRKNEIDCSYRARFVTKSFL
jgi:hypothetical protein